MALLEVENLKLHFFTRQGAARAVDGVSFNIEQNETFGLIDTAEKSAEVLVKVLSMGGMKQTITRDELIALGKRFNVQPLQSALDLYP